MHGLGRFMIHIFKGWLPLLSPILKVFAPVTHQFQIRRWSRVLKKVGAASRCIWGLRCGVWKKLFVGVASGRAR